VKIYCRVRAGTLRRHEFGNGKIRAEEQTENGISEIHFFSDLKLCYLEIRSRRGPSFF
jgi:hypothetical protein